MRLHPHNIAQKTEVIDLINERFGTDFTEADQLFFDQIVEAALSHETLRQAAEVNSQDKFSLVFNSFPETLFIERMHQNVEIFARYMNDPDFQKAVAAWLSAQAYQRLSRSGPVENRADEEGG